MKHYRCFGSLCWNHISIFGLPICSSQSLLPENVHRSSISCICACAGFCFLAFDGQSCNMQLPSETGKTQPTLEYLECHLKVKALCNCNSLGFCLARRMCVCVCWGILSDVCCASFLGWLFAMHLMQLVLGMCCFFCSLSLSRLLLHCQNGAARKFGCKTHDGLQHWMVNILFYFFSKSIKWYFNNNFVVLKIKNKVKMSLNKNTNYLPSRSLTRVLV